MAPSAASRVVLPSANPEIGRLRPGGTTTTTDKSTCSSVSTVGTTPYIETPVTDLSPEFLLAGLSTMAVIRLAAAGRITTMMGSSICLWPTVVQVLLAPHSIFSTTTTAMARSQRTLRILPPATSGPGLLAPGATTTMTDSLTCSWSTKSRRTRFITTTGTAPSRRLRPAVRQTTATLSDVPGGTLTTTVSLIFSWPTATAYPPKTTFSTETTATVTL